MIFLLWFCLQSLYGIWLDSGDDSDLVCGCYALTVVLVYRCKKKTQKQKPDLKARHLKHFRACFITMLIYSRNHFIWQRPIVNVYKSKKAQSCRGTISSLGLSSSSCIMILRTSKPWTQWLFVLSYRGKNQMENHFPSVSVADGWLQRKTDRTSRTALLTVSIRTTNLWPFHIFKTLLCP